MKKGYTLMEILIIVTLIAVLLIAAFVLLNPSKQFQKSNDTKRKHELSQLQKVLEDWYNDKQCYPKPQEICYGQNPQNPCFICGNESNSPSFAPYLNKLPCDPKHPQKKYLYQVDNTNCPSWYRIYTDLDLSDYTNNDPATEELNCHAQSCGPAPDYGYDYGVTSPNIDLERNTAFAYCAKSGCNACGNPSTYESCLKINPSDYCEGKRLIIPFNLCDRSNCPCQP